MTARKSGEAMPCPFCGAAPAIVPWHGGGPRKTSVHCDNDRCVAAPGVIGPTRAGAVRHWNNRDPVVAAAPDLLAFAECSEAAEHADLAVWYPVFCKHGLEASGLESDEFLSQLRRRAIDKAHAR